MIFYTAFRMGQKHVIWPTLSKGIPENYTTISHDDKKLINPANIKINTLYGIVLYKSTANMIMTIANTIVTLDIGSILRFMSECTNKDAFSYLARNANDVAFKNVSSLIDTDNNMFDVDEMTILFKKRRWPVSVFSPESWKTLCMKTGYEINWMIRVVKTRIGKDEKAEAKEEQKEASYDYMDGLQLVEIDASVQDLIKEGRVKEFAAFALTQENNHTATQYYSWLLVTDIPEKHRKMATSLGARFLKGGSRTRPIGKAIHDNKRFGNFVFADLSKHVITLNELLGAKMNNMFMLYICTMLSLPVYIKIIREYKLIARMTAIMKERPVFEDMVFKAMSCAMYYMTRFEHDSSTFSANIDDPFVLTLDMINALPQCNLAPESNPYIPMGISIMKYGIPFMIGGEHRRPVPTKDVLERINITAVGVKSRIDFVNIVPWCALDLVLTGSRMATCAFIGPQEAIMFKGDFDRYIAEYVGTSEHEIKEAINAYSELKTDDIVVDLKTEESLDDNILVIKQITEKIKKNKMTDIDICVGGDIEDFDRRAMELVEALREHGTVFMVRHEKANNRYSWTIFADFLRYTIDAFHVKRSSIRLIVGYMTSYPRIYYDGVSIIATSYYACCRMSGVNLWHEHLSMSDPIQIMLKSAKREQITMLINYRESKMLEDWCEDKKHCDPVFGSVSCKHEFFWNEKEVNMEHINSEQHWLNRTYVTPKTRTVIPMWNYKDMQIERPTSDMFVKFVK
jgi:hypothetical protein